MRCFFADEGHVEPRRVLPKLHERIIAAGGTIKFQTANRSPPISTAIVIDCRGLSAARDTQPALRGVKGRADPDRDRRGIFGRVRWRLIHPRWPLYVISARKTICSCWGATSIEAEDTGRQRPLRAWELLGAAYGRASGVRRSAPSSSSARDCGRHFPTILPRIAIDNDRIAVERALSPRFFLIAPALAELTLSYVEARPGSTMR